ncbi:18293_t:CDS:2, partial [Racocetra fulgida]
MISNEKYMISNEKDLILSEQYTRSRAHITGENRPNEVLKKDIRSNFAHVMNEREQPKSEYYSNRNEQPKSEYHRNPLDDIYAYRREPTEGYCMDNSGVNSSTQNFTTSPGENITSENLYNRYQSPSYYNRYQSPSYQPPSYEYYSLKHQAEMTSRHSSNFTTSPDENSTSENLYQSPSYQPSSYDYYSLKHQAEMTSRHSSNFTTSPDENITSENLYNRYQPPSYDIYSLKHHAGMTSRHSSNNREQSTSSSQSSQLVPYDENLQVVAWGYPALYSDPYLRKRAPQRKPVEQFMLHLANIRESEKPPLLPGLDAKTVITDYLQTVNLATRILLPGMKISEIIERSGSRCGSSYVDHEFLKFLGRKLGFAAMKKLKEDHNGQMQILIQRFCSEVKFRFNGNPNEFTDKELDIEKICPALKQYVTGHFRKQMEDDDWIIELDFQTVKDMFDPVINKIIDLIQWQCASNERKLAAMFLIGEFSENRYLETQIRRHFEAQISYITVPIWPNT